MSGQKAEAIGLPIRVRRSRSDYGPCCRDWDLDGRSVSEEFHPFIVSRRRFARPRSIGPNGVHLRSRASGSVRLGSMLRALLMIVSVCVLAGCSSGEASAPRKADITKVTEVKSSFGPEFKVKQIAKRAVDPTAMSGPKLPPGMAVDPPECAKVVLGPEIPPGLQGSMAGVSAEGDSNRFMVIALETSAPVPFPDDGRHCSKVTFSGSHVQGTVEAVDVPKIDGTRTVGMHRLLQSGDEPSRSNELYQYVAQFDDYEIIITANPVPIPDQPVVLVDTERARDLLVKAVAAVRG
jgi:hypothetical protein